MVDKVFANQLGQNMEVYIDDMLVKSKKRTSHVEDLRETFTTMRKCNLRLNLEKCAFGVFGEKFLGFMVTQRGIEANPTKIKAVMEMESPKCIRDVQKLTGRLAALSRFPSKSGDKNLPFFKALRNAKNFEWTDKCQKAFEGLKKYLVNPPLLTKPEPIEPLYLYLSSSKGAVSVVLIKEENKIQKPVYYLSKVLNDAEMRYPVIERLALALVSAARKLRPYFLSHPINVLTDQPLKNVLLKPDQSGRLVKWAVELSEYDIHFQPRTAIKAQALENFILEGVEIEENGKSSIE